MKGPIYLFKVHYIFTDIETVVSYTRVSNIQQKMPGPNHQQYCGCGRRLTTPPRTGRDLQLELQPPPERGARGAIVEGPRGEPDRDNNNNEEIGHFDRLIQPHELYNPNMVRMSTRDLYYLLFLYNTC